MLNILYQWFIETFEYLIPLVHHISIYNQCWHTMWLNPIFVYEHDLALNIYMIKDVSVFKINKIKISKNRRSSPKVIKLIFYKWFKILLWYNKYKI